jgi:hypothetical protein
MGAKTLIARIHHSVRVGLAEEISSGLSGLIDARICGCWNR